MKDVGGGAGQTRENTEGACFFRILAVFSSNPTTVLLQVLALCVPHFPRTKTKQHTE